MTSAAGNRNMSFNVLNFFCDDSGGCAVTVMQNGVRYQFIARAEDFDDDASGPAGRSSREYNKLVHALRAANEQAEEDQENREAESAGSSDTAHESGKDISLDNNNNGAILKAGFELDALDIEQQLQKWLLQPAGPILEELAPAEQKSPEPSVHAWYNCSTHFFNLTLDDAGDLCATELEETPELQERIRDLMPQITLPKYIRNLSIPRFNATDLTVLSESSQPEPYHPSLVYDASSDQTFFLKMVDSSAPGPAKREINLLKEIERKGLHRDFNVPNILGLVCPSRQANTIIGFLMTAIQSPTPLTQFLDEDVPRSRREAYAKEVKRIKDVLHANDIVFGDMKADNFLVDEKGELWIIDFGGMYTVGWVDPELNETREGDEMGVRKIVGALKDPAADMEEGDRGVHQDWEAKEKKGRGKRKRVDSAGDSGSEGKSDVSEEEREENSSKKMKSEEDEKKEEVGTDEETFCICDGPDSGRMIACEKEDCEKQWFHFECVGLTDAPEGKWYCRRCLNL